MKKFCVLFLLAGFVLWILPLGYFIKPAQEKAACDGQRAMCMCHVFIPKLTDKAADSTGTFKEPTGSANKENSGGAGNYFLSAKPHIVLDLRSRSLFDNQPSSYANPFLASLEYVPKI